METITENNKLIAEFMEFEKTKQGGLYISPEGFKWERFLDVENYILPNQFLFHSSWDWLMKVVEKIESLEKERFKVEIYGTICTIIDTEELYEIFTFNCDTKLKITYLCCVEFIKWYNEQNKNNESL